MKNMFEPATAAELLNRIDTLNQHSKKQWGKMDQAQMLAHCTAVLEMATGDRKLPRNLIGRIFGRLARKKILVKLLLEKIFLPIQACYIPVH